MPVTCNSLSPYSLNNVPVTCKSSFTPVSFTDVTQISCSQTRAQHHTPTSAKVNTLVHLALSHEGDDSSPLLLQSARGLVASPLVSVGNTSPEYTAHTSIHSAAHSLAHNNSLYACHHIHTFSTSLNSVRTFTKYIKILSKRRHIRTSQFNVRCTYYRLSACHNSYW